MRYVNVTTGCFADVAMKDGIPIAYTSPFDKIYASLRQNGDLEVGGFKVATNFSIVGTSLEENRAGNILEQRGILDVIIRLTKCDPIRDNRLCLDLDCFSLDLKKMKSHIGHACYDFFNYTRITSVLDFDLEAGVGAYVIKVLVKKHEDDESKYVVQAMSRLYVDNPKREE